MFLMFSLLLMSGILKLPRIKSTSFIHIQSAKMTSKTENTDLQMYVQRSGICESPS